MRTSFLLFIGAMLCLPIAAQDSYFIPETQLGTNTPNSVSLDINRDTDLLTMVLKGPADGWFGLGFNAKSMDDGTDVVYVTPSDFVDATIQGFFRPVADTMDTPQHTNDWTVTSNTTTSDNMTRTVVATRSIISSDTKDFQFPDKAPSELDLVWAYGVMEDGRIQRHTNRGFITVNNFTLDINQLFTSEFAMWPNPVQSNLQIRLPERVRSGTISIVDIVGKVLFTTTITQQKFSLSTSRLPVGLYLIRFTTNQGTITKKFLKN